MLDEATVEELIVALQRRFHSSVILLYLPRSGEIGGEEADYCSRYDGSVITNIGQAKIALGELLRAEAGVEGSEQG